MLTYYLATITVRLFLTIKAWYTSGIKHARAVHLFSRKVKRSHHQESTVSKIFMSIYSMFSKQNTTKLKTSISLKNKNQTNEMWLDPLWQ